MGSLRTIRNAMDQLPPWGCLTRTTDPRDSFASNIGELRPMNDLKKGGHHMRGRIFGSTTHRVSNNFMISNLSVAANYLEKRAEIRIVRRQKQLFTRLALGTRTSRDSECWRTTPLLLASTSMLVLHE